MNVGCFIIINLILGAEYIFLLAQDNAAVVNDGRWWQLLTAIFIHADAYHLFNNMLFLLFFGTAAEEFYSHSQYLLIYFGAGLMGGIFTLLLTPIDSVGLGASGAILGLVGAVFISLSSRDRFILIIGVIYVINIIYNSFCTWHWHVGTYIRTWFWIVVWVYNQASWT